MMAKRVTCALVALATAASQAHARNPLEASAEIVRIRDAAGGSVVITRSTKAIVAAFGRQLLFDGDEIRASGTSRAEIRDFISHRDLVVTAASGPVRINGVRQRRWSSGAQNYLAAFAHIFDQVPSPIVIFTLTRGPDANPVRPSPLFASLVQKVVPEAREQPVIWLNAPGQVTVQTASRPATVISPTETAGAAISIESLPADVTVSGASGSTIRWHIVADAHVPSPPWRNTYPDKTETAERVAAAAWILTSGPSEWRLFALAELRDLSSNEPAADRLWRAVRSGDWPGKSTN